MLQRFPSKFRQKWYDPEDAFSDVILKVYQDASQSDFKTPPEKDHWHKFLHQRMRQKLWLVKRRDGGTLTADAGAMPLATVEANKKGDDPVEGLETLDELGVLVPQVKEVLSPQQQTVFFGKAQDLTNKEIADAARTSPDSVRVQGNKAEKKMKKLREKLKNDMVA